MRMIALMLLFKTHLFFAYRWSASFYLEYFCHCYFFHSYSHDNYIRFCDITFVSMTITFASVTDLSIPPKFLETPFTLLHLLVQTILICINDTLSLPRNITINYWLNDFIIFSHLRDVVRKKWDYVGKIPKWQTPSPPPPSLGLFTFFTVFYKPLNWKKQRKIWSGFGSDPSPLFGNFPHIIPFFFWQRPSLKL